MKLTVVWRTYYATLTRRKGQYRKERKRNADGDGVATEPEPGLDRLSPEGANFAPRMLNMDLEDIEMKRSHFFTLAAAFSLGACTDNPVAPGPGDPQQPILPTPSTTTIAGRIRVVGGGADLVVELRDGFDNVYRLVGSNAAALASVDGGDVIARGTFDANPGFVVQEFEVTAMYGRPALDGWLEATDEGLAVRLVDGSLRFVPGLPENCAEHLGARLWVIGWDEETPITYGLIS